MSRGRGFGGNREVPPLLLLGLRGDLSGAWAEAYTEKEGGSWERYASWCDTSEPKARDAHAVTAAGIKPFSSSSATIFSALSSGDSLSESIRISGCSGCS